MMQHLGSLALVGRHNTSGNPDFDGWRYRSWAELILANGRMFAPPAADVIPRQWRGAPTTCYVSAALWSTSEGLPYVEGFGATVGFSAGVEHAWCLAEDGCVLDPVWAVGQGRAYIGVPFTA